MKPDVDEQVTILMEGTEYGDPQLKQAMAAELRDRLIEADREGRPLKVYCGFDPTSSDLHLGHTVPMRKLRQFQDLGHDVVFLIGSFTALIGDMSDRETARPKLTPPEVRRNARTYAQQAHKILDPAKTTVLYNAQWLRSVRLSRFLELASAFSVQQCLTRENFRKRRERGEPIFLHELLYAVLQGYDAWKLQADVQVGGSDQLFNIVTAGRKLMTLLGGKPNVAIILDILPGTDGKQKMGKSLGNHIPLLAGPDEMFGKTMSMPDEPMVTYFRLLTRLSPNQIAEVERGLANGSLDPRDTKKRLAAEIVSIYHDEGAAVRAEREFERVCKEKRNPIDMPEYRVTPGQNLVDIIYDSGLVKAKSEARRLIRAGSVRYDGEKITDHFYCPTGPGVLKVGKLRFLRLVFAAAAG